jgi:hypothetical protein
MTASNRSSGRTSSARRRRDGASSSQKACASGPSSASGHAIPAPAGGIDHKEIEFALDDGADTLPWQDEAAEWKTVQSRGSCRSNAVKTFRSESGASASGWAGSIRGIDSYIESPGLLLQS